MFLVALVGIKNPQETGHLISVGEEQELLTVSFIGVNWWQVSFFGRAPSARFQRLTTTEKTPPSPILGVHCGGGAGGSCSGILGLGSPLLLSLEHDPHLPVSWEWLCKLGKGVPGSQTAPTLACHQPPSF